MITPEAGEAEVSVRSAAKEQGAHEPNRSPMISEIEVHNFKCFEHLKVQDCRRINVIVGDNGGGKTALLEAIFLALASGTDMAVRFRQQRGLEGNFAGHPKAIEDAIFGDLFYDRDLTRTVSVDLLGSGPEARSLRISRSAGSFLEAAPAISLNGGVVSSAGIASFRFEWKDEKGNSHEAVPQITQGGFQLGGTGEVLPDFFFFPSGQTITSIEMATKFSSLSRARKERQFVDFFCREYTWIEDLSIEVVGGAAALHATVCGLSEKIPVANIGGAINRLIGIMLAIASRPQGVVLVDEMENGVYHKHHTAMWHSILSLARQHECQIFTSTHNEEWLEALIEAAGDEVADLALWRLERADDRPVLRQFFGRTFKGSIEAGGEVR